MQLLIRFAFLEGCALVIGLFAIVAFKIANGTISLADLLFAKEAGRTKTVLRRKAGGEQAGAEKTDYEERRVFSPARLQLLIFTVAVAANYLHRVIVNTDPHSLPDVPQGVINALGGSQAVYIAGKALSTYIEPLHKNLR
ncbi:MAG TPA: hypothetical protein VHG32_05325 [Thermoanaerobaculia bacterium]|jgi:hypothetical protein|nr:hypothetical protein [Thermoanaerobaculia bacterium]